MKKHLFGKSFFNIQLNGATYLKGKWICWFNSRVMRGTRPAKSTPWIPPSLLTLVWCWISGCFGLEDDWSLKNYSFSKRRPEQHRVCMCGCVCVHTIMSTSKSWRWPLINPKSVGDDMLDSLVSKSGDMVLVAISPLHIWAETAFTDDMRYFFPIRASPPHTLTIPPQRADWHWQRGLGKPFMGAANTLNSAY